MPRIVREHRLLGLFSVTYLVVFTLVGVHAGQRAIVYLAAMVVFFLAVARVYSRVRLTAGVLWALSMWGLLHMAGGLVAVDDGVLYAVQVVPGALRFDQFVHAFGFGAATVAVWEVLATLVAPVDRGRPAVLVLAALGGLGLGALNEVFEFAASQMFDATNVGGYLNTGWDLVFNLLGSAAAAAWISTRRTDAPADARSAA